MVTVAAPALPRVPVVSRWTWAVAALILVFLLSFMVGRYPVAPHTALAILASKILPIHPFWPQEAETVVMRVRLPRILAAMIVGAALSASGTVYQSVFKNPLVSPDVLGVAAGAGFGAAIALLLGAGATGIQMAAFGCGLAAVAIACAVGLWRGGRNGGYLVLVLAGVIVDRVFEAGISFAKYAADPNNVLPAITFWLMGSVAAVSPADLAAAALPIAVGLAVLLSLRWRLNVMSFGDEEARALGLDVTRFRLVVIVAATLTTSAAVAISGVLSLVGLIVPHLARMLVGPNHTVLLPVSILMGAGFLLAVDDLARALVAGEIPLGILTALIGAPFFIAVLVRMRAGWSA
jgi:iron complex transport system permease protein